MVNYLHQMESNLWPVIKNEGSRNCGDCETEYQLFSQSPYFCLIFFLTADRQPVLVLLSGRQSAADMAFRLVHIQDDAGAGGQGRIDVL